MTNPANTLYLTALMSESISPAIVDKVSDDEMYIGYCSPDCRGYDDNKWLIKRIMTDADGQKIFTANGEKKANQKWSERKLLKYGPTPVWVNMETPPNI